MAGDSLVRIDALAQLPAAAVRALVQPGVAINGYLAAPVLADVSWTGYALEHRKEPSDPHPVRLSLQGSPPTWVVPLWLQAGAAQAHLCCSDCCAAQHARSRVGVKHGCWLLLTGRRQHLRPQCELCGQYPSQRLCWRILQAPALLDVRYPAGVCSLLSTKLKC